MNEIRELKTEFLMYLNLDLKWPDDKDRRPPQPIGQTPFGYKTVSRQAYKGEFEGPHLKGTTMEGADWFTIINGNGIVDWRGTLKTDDGAYLYMEQYGFIHTNPDPNGSEDPEIGLKRFLGCRQEETFSDYSKYYFRTSIKITTGDPKYQWLNGLVCVAVGERKLNNMCYSIYAIK